MANSNRRQPPPRNPSTSPNGASPTAATATPGPGPNGSAAAKPKKPRKTEDEIIAEAHARIAAAESRKALKAIAENKPLAKAVKAAAVLRKWLPDAVAAAVDAHIKRLVAANAASEADVRTLADKMLGSGDADVTFGAEMRGEA